MSSRLAEKWRKAAVDLGLDVRVPYEVEVEPGNRITVDLLVKNFGGTRGMLVLSNYASIREYREKIVQLGYGYSVMSEPSPGVPADYDREVLVDVLRDWGWTGEPDRRPLWLGPK